MSHIEDIGKALAARRRLRVMLGPAVRPAIHTTADDVILTDTYVPQVGDRHEIRAAAMHCRKGIDDRPLSAVQPQSSHTTRSHRPARVTAGRDAYPVDTQGAAAMKTYTAAEIHELIERAAAGHDKLALDFRNTTDKLKAETLRRWAVLFVPLTFGEQDPEGPRCGYNMGDEVWCGLRRHHAGDCRQAER